MNNSRGLGFRIVLWSAGLLIVQFAAGSLIYVASLEKATKGLLWFSLLVLSVACILMVVRKLLQPLKELEIRLATPQWDHPLSQSFPSSEIENMQEAIAKRSRLQFQKLTNWVAQAEALHDPLRSIQNGLAKQNETIQQYQFLVSQKLDAASGVAGAMGQTKLDAENLNRLLFDAKEQCGKSIRQLQQVFQSLASAKEGQVLRIERLADLLKRFHQVDEIIRRVHTINDQTKLIAFNASIEASTSGETGRRFGIVASDIRTLSQTIDASNSDMKEALNGLREAIETIVNEARSETHRVKDSVTAFGDNLGLLATVFSELEKSVATAGHLVSHADHRRRSANTVDEAMRAMSENAWALAESARAIDQEMKSVTSKYQSMTSTF